MDNESKIYNEIVEYVKDPNVFADLYTKLLPLDLEVNPEELVELKIVESGGENTFDEVPYDSSDWVADAVIFMRDTDNFFALFPVLGTQQMGIYFQQGLRRIIDQYYGELVDETEGGKELKIVPLILVLNKDIDDGKEAIEKLLNGK